MELRVLRYFLTLAREENISRAAEALYITQPTLSRQLAELEEDIVSIDDLIGLAESEMGQKIFGENAKNVSEEGRQAKAAGAKYCFCDACKAVEAILSKKAEMLA